jgi:hypothetical protein
MPNVPILCEFSFPCDRQWGELKEISGEDSVRYCGECSKPVFLCHSYDDLIEHVQESRCVAIAGPDDMRLGRVST